MVAQVHSIFQLRDVQAWHVVYTARQHLETLCNLQTCKA